MGENMMNFTGQQLQSEFAEVFNMPITELTTRQLWWLVKVIKHCRGRCRNNAALKNYLSYNFPGHIFGDETKTGFRGSYKAMTIKKKNTEEVPVCGDSDEE